MDSKSNIPTTPLLPEVKTTELRTYNLKFQKKNLIIKVRELFVISYSIGVAFGSLLLFLGFSYYSSNIKAFIFFMVFGVTFLIASLLKMRNLFVVRIFNTANDSFETVKNAFIRYRQYCKLSDILSVQLLEKNIKDTIGKGNSDYAKNRFCYEVNLVLKDGSRLNVLNYPHKKAIQQQAQEFSDFLGVPLWSMLNEESK